jgi:hypothetical protein
MDTTSFGASYHSWSLALTPLFQSSSLPSLTTMFLNSRTPSTYTIAYRPRKVCYLMIKPRVLHF